MWGKAAARVFRETYAVLAGVEAPEGVDKRDFYFTIALLDHLYWIAAGAA